MPMKRYTPDELQQVLTEDQKWLRDEEGGSRANLYGANLSGADLSGADLSGANLSRADLSRANLSGANLSGVKIVAIRVFSGLYEYQCQAVISVDGDAWIRMGCLWKSLEDWDSIGIRKSNISEFPDDGSEKSERRARAFDYVRAEVLVMADKFKEEAESTRKEKAS